MAPSAPYKVIWTLCFTATNPGVDVSLGIVDVDLVLFAGEAVGGRRAGAAQAAVVAAFALAAAAARRQLDVVVRRADRHAALVLPVVHAVGAE